MTLEFLFTSLVVILLPGTGVIYTVAIGLSRGFRPGRSDFLLAYSIRWHIAERAQPEAFAVLSRVSSPVCAGGE